MVNCKLKKPFTIFHSPFTVFDGRGELRSSRKHSAKNGVKNLKEAQAIPEFQFTNGFLFAMLNNSG